MHTPREIILKIYVFEIKPQSTLSGLGLMLTYMHVDTISYYTLSTCEDCTDKMKCVVICFRQFIEFLVTQKHKYLAL